MSAAPPFQRHGPGRLRVEALDLLRLLAALLVVIYHYTFHGPGAFDLTWFSLPEAVPVTKYFYLGVPLFFVISGFVIPYSAEGRPLQRYVVARFARIYPGFIFCMTVTFLVVLLLGAPRLETSTAQWVANLLVAAPAFGQRYIDSVYWSIVIEIVFYGWAALAVAFGLFDRRLPELVAGWLAISLANELFLGSGLVQRIFITNYSGFFSAGLMLYLLFRGRREPLVWLLFFAATALGAVQENWNADWQRARSVELSAPVVIAGSVAAVLLVAGGVFIRRVPLPAALILALGGLTYPLYLLHQIVGYAVINQLERFALPPLVLLGGMIAGIVALSWLIYRFVETPARRRTAAVLDGACDALIGAPAAKRAASSSR